MPRPQWHLLSACATYFPSKRYLSRGEAQRVAAASVLIDLDHLVDLGYYRCTNDRRIQLVPLHSWELAIALLIVPSRATRMIGIGFLYHLILDASVGEYSLLRLSLVYRISKRFRTDYLGDWALWPAQGSGRSLIRAERGC